MIGNLVLVPLLCSTAAALQMTGPSTYTAGVGSIAHIPCTFTADKLPADPRFFSVLWYLEGKMILSSDDTITSTDPRYSLDKSRALHGIADLTISNAIISDSGDYTCSVTYSPYRTEKKIRVEISAAALQMTGPSTYMARVGSIAHIPCTFTADKLPADPKYLSVLWYLEGKMILSSDDTITSPDPRYSLDKYRALNGTADLTITNAFVSDGGDYTCSVINDPYRIAEKIRVKISAQPLVSILTKSVQRNAENTLTCMVSGFFPSDIDVTWYKDGGVLKNQLMGKPHKNDKGTYQVNSTVTITPNDDDQNKILSCRVQHVSLQEPQQDQFPLIYQESSSHVIMILNVILVVVIIAAGFIGIVLWLIQQRRGFMRASSICRRAFPPKMIVKQQVIGNETQESIKDIEQEEQPLSLIREAEETPYDTATNRKHSSTQNTGRKSPKEHLLLKQKDLQSPDHQWTPKIVLHTPKKSEEEEEKDNRLLPDLEIGEIIVPDLIAGKRAKLSCKLYNYILGEHKCSWYVKEKSTGEVISANSDTKKLQSIGKDETSYDQNTSIAYLTLVPVEMSDDGSEFILRVNLPYRVIERNTGPIHVKGQLPDPEVGEITVPDLIAGKRAKLSCKLYNYILREHKCSWHVKVKSTGDIIHGNYDGKKHQGIVKDETSDGQNTSISYLELVPVQKSDDGSEFILRVNLPDRVIERSTGPIHVKDAKRSRSERAEVCSSSDSPKLMKKETLPTQTTT